MSPIHVVLAGLLAGTVLAGAPAVAFAQESGQEAERQAVPRGSRPQGDNPRTGAAVPRSAPRREAAPPDESGPRVRSGGVRPGTVRSGGIRTRERTTVIVPDRRRTVVVRPPVYGYSNYPGYYPRHYYPYGYGAFGLGYFYYDPYRWGSATTYSGYPYGAGTGYYRPYDVFDIGELRLDVSPRNAQVYVDGYYAGVVDDYDGTFQALKLESGAHRIEIVAPGHETLTFDVRLDPGQKIRYRGELRRF